MVESIRKRVRTLIAFGWQYGRWIAIGLLLLFGVLFLINGWSEILKAIDLLGQVSLYHVLLLAGLQAIVVAVAGITYKILLGRQGHRISTLRLCEVHLRRILVGAITPLGGPASLYVLVRALRPHGVPANDVLIAGAMRSIAGLVAFLLLLIPVLLLHANSTLVLVAASVLIASLLVLLAGSTVLLRRTEVPLELQRWLPAPALQFVHTARGQGITTYDFAVPVGTGIISHLSTATMLYVGLYAVGYEASVGTVVIGYVIGKLFFMMAPVFQGIGVVEFGVALALQQAGVAPAVAVSASLLYRVGDLWLPLSWALLIQVAQLRVLARLRGRRSSTPSGARRRMRQIPSRFLAAASRIFRMRQTVLSVAITLTLSAAVWATFGSGLLQGA